MKSMIAALQFLTRIRVRQVKLRESDLGFSLLWYPVVGALTGIVCGVFYVFVLRFLWPRGVGLLVLVTVLVGLKDAFHLDGLSDLVDGLFGGETPEEVYSIMKDPNLGPFGALAILVVLALESSVLLTLPARLILPVLAGVLALSTGTAALLLCWGRPVKGKRGLATLIMNHRRTWFGPFILVLMLVIPVIALGLSGVALFALTGLLTWGLLYFYYFRLGGINGDCCGASVMLVQIVLLLTVSFIQFQGILPLESVLTSW